MNKISFKTSEPFPHISSLEQIRYFDGASVLCLWQVTNEEGKIEACDDQKRQEGQVPEAPFEDGKQEGD